MKKIGGLIILISAWAFQISAKHTKPFPIPNKNNQINILMVNDIQAYFHYYPEHSIIISSHRR